MDRDRWGMDIIHDPLYNKGIAFSERERDRFSLRGLLPARVMTIEEQVSRAYDSYCKVGEGPTFKVTPSITKADVDKHIYLTNLQDRNEVLFYRLLCEHIEEMAPIVYTPVVGYVCQQHGQLWRRSRGLWINGFTDVGDMHAIMNNWPAHDVDVIVITDGSRILGLGDLGAYGMGIPVGKLITYVAAGGIHPSRVLPMMLDVGTDNQDLIKDPLYFGEKKPRIKGEAYMKVWSELMDAINYRFPTAMVQHEDIKSPNAEILLEKYRHQTLLFNDDIQGTGAMVVAGLLAALRVKGIKGDKLKNQRILCLGAGSAGIGVCSALRKAILQEGVSDCDSYKRFWVIDKDGLLTNSRTVVLGEEVKHYCRDIEADKQYMTSGSVASDIHMQCDFNLHEGMSFEEVVKKVKPTVILGLSGVGRAFTESSLRTMTSNLKQFGERPIVFSLSNPTDKSECTAEQAYDWTDGSVIFAGGSPFPPVVRNGVEVMYPAQGNNIFIYPGLGLACIATKAERVTDEMLYAASRKLASLVTEEDLQKGRLFPRVREIRKVSLQIAIAVANKIVEQNLNGRELPAFKVSWDQYVEDCMFRPEYQSLIVERVH
jgi:malic enzyme